MTETANLLLKFATTCEDKYKARNTCKLETGKKKIDNYNIGNNHENSVHSNCAPM